MTESEIRARVVTTAVSYLGCNGKDGNHKPIIDLYNAMRPLPRGYTVKYTDAWCATFVSAIGQLCGLTDIMPRECGCPDMIALYKKLGRWREDENYTPMPGDIIFYDWSDSGKGDNVGNPDHVGIVASVSGNTIKVIEGNKGNAVGYRTMPVNGRYIRGYGLPDYFSKEDVKMDYKTFKELFDRAMAEHNRDINEAPVSSWAAESWEKATKAGVFDGTKPTAKCSREQMAVVLDRLGPLKGGE